MCLRTYLLVLVAVLMLAVACNQEQGAGSEEGTKKVPPLRHQLLAGVNDWTCFINEPDLDALQASGFDLVVMDYSGDGSELAEFTPAQIRALKDSGHIVLAYLSIGEAEDYRFYWEMARGVPGAGDWTNNPPAWLGPENPYWPGNYRVRYWKQEWQQIIIHNPGGHPVLGGQPSYLDRILEQGFDGVYLDIVDGWEFWGPQGDGGNGENPQAALHMAHFVEALAQYARSVDPDFIVCPQNGANIISPYLERPLSEEESQVYLAIIDAIGAEDTFYFGPQDQDNPWNPQTEVMSWLEEYRSQGIMVLALEYLTDPAKIDKFYQEARARFWVPYATVRALDQLTIPPGYEPD